MVTDGAELHFTYLSGTLIAYHQFELPIFRKFLEIVDDLLGVLIGAILLKELSSDVFEVVQLGAVFDARHAFLHR